MKVTITQNEADFLCAALAHTLQDNIWDMINDNSERLVGSHLSRNESIFILKKLCRWAGEKDLAKQFAGEGKHVKTTPS